MAAALLFFKIISPENVEGTSSSFSSSPSDYVCRGNQVTVIGSVDYDGKYYGWYGYYGCGYGYYGEGSATIEVSDIGGYSQTLSPGNNSVSYSFYGTLYLLHIWQSQQAQNNSQPSCIFLDHQVVIYNNKIYDPSYGQCYTSLAEWEASSVSDFTVRYDDNGILKSRVLVNPPSTTECDYDTNY